MARGIKKEIIAKYSRTAYDCFDGRGYSDFVVSGLLIKYSWLGLTWYRIEVFKPHVSGMYDGCFMTRAKLKSYASTVRSILKQKLIEHKYGCSEH